MGSKRIWALIRAFSGKFSKANMKTYDLDLEVLKTLQNYMVREDNLLYHMSESPRLMKIMHIINLFLKPEFYSALAKCKKDLATGIDKISYFTIKRLPSPCLDMIRGFLMTVIFDLLSLTINTFFARRDRLWIAFPF